MTPDYKRIAVLGGVYSNYLALQTALGDAGRRGAEAVFCLGDMGAFGPHPDYVIALLQKHEVQCIQGNYDFAIGNGLPDCQCGYTDPRDNHFARRSYAYTLANTSPPHRDWLRNLPAQRRILLGGRRLLLCHGSPRRTNEFLWESTCPSHFLEHLCRTHQADVILTTHTGIKWRRELADGRHFINVGVLGRPENDGRTNVWYAILESGRDLHVEFVPLSYDYERLAAAMEAENLPEEFVTTLRTGWWTTCLEVLPAKERSRGKF